MTVRLHILKIWPEFLHEIINGNNTASLRKADRDYRVGDWVELRGYDANLERYTASAARCEITHIVAPGHPVFPPVLKDYVLLSLRHTPFPNDTDVQVIEPKE